MVKPKKAFSCVLFFGTGHSAKAETFLSSGYIFPSRTLNPRISKSSAANLHFLVFTVNPDHRRRSKTFHIFQMRIEIYTKDQDIINQAASISVHASKHQIQKSLA